MWSSQFLLCLLLGGAVLANRYQGQGDEQSYAWKSGSEYKYRVQGRTLTAFHQVADQYTGMLMNAELTVQPKSADTLRAQISQAQYAQIHTELPGGWDSEIPENMLNYKNLPMSGKPFEIKLKNGAIDDLLVEQDIPNWEVNVLKSIVSQLQVDAQGENLISSQQNQKPEGNQPFAAYKTMEDSVTGRCEVHYDILPLSEYALQVNPELAPLPHLHGNEQMIDVVKSKNFSHCHQLSVDYDAFSGVHDDQPGSNNRNIVSRSSTSRIILSGSLDRHTIQSSVTINKVVMSPLLHDEQNGMVVSRVNLTLAKVNGQSSSSSISSPSNPKSTGNLVYRYSADWNHDEDNDEGSSSSSSSSDSSSDTSSDSDSSSDSSSSSSSSSSSEEEQKNRRYRRSAHQRRSGNSDSDYDGSSRQESSVANVARECEKIARQIGNEIQDPSSIPERQTLERFDSLVGLIRAMNAKEIDRAQQALYQPADKTNPNSQSDSSRRSAWVAYRDAVAAAGTEQALQNIKQWIQQGKIRGYEAAQIVASLPKINRMPSAKYLETFFSMVTLPEVSRQAYLNTSAILSLTDLARAAQVHRGNTHKRYPVHGLAGLSSKDQSAAVRQYLPYLTNQLKSAIRNADSPKILVYIRALGNLGHPQILRVFEPYLEGEKDVSDFQRLAIVMAMDKLCQFYPKLAQSVLFKIYRNTGEVSEVRTAAVFQLMKTNPPARMLQRMAVFTKWDLNKQVNSAVRTAIEDAAALENEEEEELANNARAARDFLSSQEHGYEYSQGHFRDYTMENINIAYKLSTFSIASDDRSGPLGLYAGLEGYFGNHRVRLSEIGAMVSSIDYLTSIITGQAQSDSENNSHNQKSIKGYGKWSPEKIAKLLNIQSESSNQLEGQLILNGAYAKQFFVFDNHTIDQIPNVIREAAQALKNGQSFNSTKFEDQKISWSYPTEMGFPFIFVENRPVLFKIGGEVKVRSSPDLADGSADQWNIPSTVNATADVRILHSFKMQSRIGFTTPFDSHEYMAGVNQNFQINLPLRVCFDLDIENKNVRVKLHPIQEDQEHNLIHLSTQPFTAKVDRQIYNPVPLEKNMQSISNGKLTKNEISFGEKATGMVFRMKTSSQGNSQKNIWAFVKDHFKENDPISAFAFPSIEPRIEESSYDLILDPVRSTSHAAIFSVSWNSQRYGEGNDRAGSRQLNNENAGRQEYQDKLEEQAAEGIDNADVSSVYFGVDFVEDSTARHAENSNARYEAVAAWVDSNTDSKSHYFFDYRQKSNDQKINKLCLKAEVQKPNAPELDFIETLNANYTSSVGFIVSFGERCENDAATVHVKAQMKQSSDLKNYLRQQPLAKECAKQMEQGNNALPACRSMVARANQPDEARITIKYENIPVTANDLTVIAYSLAQSMALHPDAHMSVGGSEGQGERIEIDLKLSKNFEKFDISVNAPGIDVTLTDLKNGWYKPSNLQNDEDGSTCVLDNNAANTFDNHTYPVELGNCWHVVFTTVPEEDPDNYKNDLDIPEDMQMTVLAREVSENEKEVKITLGDDEIIFSPSQSKPQVQVNGQTVQVSEDKSFTQMDDEDDEAVYDIYGLSDGSVKLSSDEYGVEAVYDGSRVKISVDGKYRGSSRGLCGTFNGQPADDFTTPQNCVVKNFEEFSASYALKDQKCEGPAKRNAQKAQKSNCTNKKTWFGNVISDEEAGRQNSGKNTWGGRKQNKSQGSYKGNCHTHQTKVVREKGQTCFSLRPIPTCNSKCHATNNKEKDVEFHCVSNGETVDKFYKNIRNGGNPDFSRKQASKTIKMTVPTSCAA